MPLAPSLAVQDWRPSIVALSIVLTHTHSARSPSDTARSATPRTSLSPSSRPTVLIIAARRASVSSHTLNCASLPPRWSSLQQTRTMTKLLVSVCSRSKACPVWTQFPRRLLVSYPAGLCCRWARVCTPPWPSARGLRSQSNGWPAAGHSGCGWAPTVRSDTAVAARARAREQQQQQQRKGNGCCTKDTGNKDGGRGRCCARGVESRPSTAGQTKKRQTKAGKQPVWRVKASRHCAGLRLCGN